MYDFIPKYPFFVKLKKLKKNYFEVLPFTIESWGKKNSLNTSTLKVKRPK